MNKYYAAIDIGASSGRVMAAWLENGVFNLEEIHRFENKMVKKGNELCWELDRLFDEILIGLKKCDEVGKRPICAGIDTWAVDYVLLDKDEKIIGNTVAYRDSRTVGMDEEVSKYISPEELYERTGIQKMQINTIYHMMSLRLNHPDYLERAESFLFVPDYFNFLLTGRKFNEYTNATTSQFVNCKTNDWDHELINRLGINEKIFQKIIMPGTNLGKVRPEIEEKIGYSLDIIAPCTHDTGSAVLAVPANDDDFIYISSGTWSLIGIERKEADSSEISRSHNFTNEGGYQHRFRYLKNIMGLWMIQSVKHEFGDKYGFSEICDMAERESDFPSIVDANDNCFLAPENMTQEIKRFCRDTDQQVPETIGQIAHVIYASLAECYAKAVKELEEISARKYSRIHIIGGGANADYLNKLTAEATGLEIHAGLSEATAIGNAAVQMLSCGEFDGVEAVRECIHNSFGIKIYQ